jgi:predicted NAD/FAD-dependent oxidoreductase
VDHGLSFIHGTDPAFLDAIDRIDKATPLPGWPKRLSGTGTPCQPEAFHDYERRVAFEEGVNVFAKHLAREIDIRRESRVVSLEPSGSRFEIKTEGGETYSASDVVVTTPVETTRELLSSIADESPDLRAARSLLSILGSDPCLTLLAGYSLDASPPTWDMCYPEDSEILLLISHDSAKRREMRFHILVYQSRSRWSRRNLDEDPASWTRTILDEASRLVGPWAAKPVWTQTHRWRYARIEQGSALSSPMLISFRDGRRLGLAGEIFAPSGGVEAAWISGRRLAKRILGAE